LLPDLTVVFGTVALINHNEANAVAIVDAEFESFCFGVFAL
jgi:hypothetical protein